MKYPEVRPGQPALILAPMEGVTDFPMRAFMSERGGFTYCVSEFLRISQDVPPARVYFDHTPELKTRCKTASGLPVQLQLLGGDPEKLARAAQLACEIGSHGVDLNFGCPAPTVNRHDGGATLLKFPERIREIVSAVRQAVPSHLPVSAKLRLGWDTMDPVHKNAEMAELGGASWITIHGRTKMQGYTPPAYWGPIGEVRKNLSIPVVANGEIWTLDDFKRCRDETRCDHFMLGRGALADPLLPIRVSQELGLSERGDGPIRMSVRAAEWRPLIERFSQIAFDHTGSAGYATRRIKQWIRMAHNRQPLPWYDTLKRFENLEDVLHLVRTFPDEPV